MRSRAAAKGRKLLFLVAVCLLPALLLSPTAEASRGLPAAGAIDLEPPIPSWDAPAEPVTPSLDLFHLEDDLLLEILAGVEPEDHVALLEHRRLELLPPSIADSAIQKTATGVSTSGFELNVQKGKSLKPDLRWAVPFYAKARFYDPEVGRFLTEDPAEPDLTSPPSLHKYLYAYGNPTYYTDPDGREVSITPKGNYVVSYPDGTVRTFTADRYAQNPAAVEAAILESVSGDEAAAKHDFHVGVLKWEYQQEHGTAPGDDEYIYQHSDETGPVYAITGSGEIHSASGDIEPDYSVETLAVTVVTGGFAASAVRAGGGTLTQGAKVLVKNVADDLAGEALGLNPSLVKGAGKLAVDRVGRSVTDGGLWKKVETPWGRGVFQRDDIDWTFVRPDGTRMAGLTNTEAAELGYAPIRINPNTERVETLVLHHVNKEPGAALTEVWSSTHDLRHAADRLAGRGLPRPTYDPLRGWRSASPALDDAFRIEQSVYWRWYKAGYVPPPGGVTVPGAIQPHLP